ncbi:MAG: hypothetical protein UZ15_CFX003003008 [Chloroflexi bacterium OLB15]|nr:MAG: hypothetical protein UZ15_CFX003003008 [Chloroflexi bacterium OLB15]
MSIQLNERAQQLANRPYHVTVNLETLNSGEVVFVLNCLELTGCIAQGETFEQAEKDFSEVLYEYILGYLEDGIPVPDPYGVTTETSGDVKRIADEDSRAEQKLVEASEDRYETNLLGASRIVALPLAV